MPLKINFMFHILKIPIEHKVKNIYFHIFFTCSMFAGQISRPPKIHLFKSFPAKTRIVPTNGPRKQKILDQKRRKITILSIMNVLITTDVGIYCFGVIIT